jgi:hypothetical protein
MSRNVLKETANIWCHLLWWRDKIKTFEICKYIHEIIRGNIRKEACKDPWKVANAKLATLQLTHCVPASMRFPFVSLNTPHEEVCWLQQSCRRFEGTYRLKLVPCSRIFQPWRWRRYVPPKRRFTQDPHGATSQKTAFFIVTAVKTSNL